MTITVACGGGGDGGGGGPPGGTPASIVVSPVSVTFGAIGSARQLTAVYKDASNNTVAGGALTYTRIGTGNIVTVSAGGLVTSTAAGTGDTILVSGSGLTAKVPVTVTQVVASVGVTSTVVTPDTLFAATRTRQLTATARDTNNNAIAGASVAWASNATGVATVGAATGLVTAVTDGSAVITATAGGITGNRTVIVRRLAATHTITPGNSAITVNAGTAGPFTGSAADSAGQALPLTWVSRNTGIFTVSPASGSTTTATAAGSNGTAQLVLTVPAGPADSVAITTSNQTGPVAPAAITVQVGDDFYKSVHNGTQQPGVTVVVDTVAVNGQVTWSFIGAALHTVTSQGSPSFTSSGNQSSGTFVRQFTVTGSYSYVCTFHANMQGTIVVR